jgi:hypothetical protein
LPEQPEVECDARHQAEQGRDRELKAGPFHGPIIEERGEDVKWSGAEIERFGATRPGGEAVPDRRRPGVSSFPGASLRCRSPLAEAGSSAIGYPHQMGQAGQSPTSVWIWKKAAGPVPGRKRLAAHPPRIVVS